MRSCVSVEKGGVVANWDFLHLGFVGLRSHQNIIAGVDCSPFHRAEEYPSSCLILSRCDTLVIGADARQPGTVTGCSTSTSSVRTYGQRATSSDHAASGGCRARASRAARSGPARRGEVRAVGAEREVVDAMRGRERWREGLPATVSQSRAVPSSLVVAIRRPFGENAACVTVPSSGKSRAAHRRVRWRTTRRRG